MATIAGEGEKINQAAIVNAAVFPEIWKRRSPHFFLVGETEKYNPAKKKKKKRNGYKNRSGNFGGEMGFPGFDPGRGENGARFSPIPEFRVGEEASGESKLPDNFNGEREIG